MKRCKTRVGMRRGSWQPLLAGGLLACLQAQVVVATPVAAPVPPVAAPAAAPAASPTRSVTAAEQEAIIKLLRELHQAYLSRDLDAIMQLEHHAIEASALDAEKRGTYKAEQVRSAFRECHRDVLTHEKFAMKPLNLLGLRYQRRGERILVRSDEPVIATEKVHLLESDMDVRLTISRFVVEKQGDTFQIVQMNLL